MNILVWFVLCGASCGLPIGHVKVALTRPISSHLSLAAGVLELLVYERKERERKKR